MRDANWYRGRAEEARTVADSMIDAATRDGMLEAAQHYEHLAWIAQLQRKPRIMSKHFSEWWICEERAEPSCLYDGAKLHRLKSDPPRCVRHGALLFYERTFDGMSRARVRAEMQAKGNA